MCSEYPGACPRAARLLDPTPFQGPPDAPEALPIPILVTSIVDPQAIFHSRLHELLGAFDGEVLVAWPGSHITPVSELPAAGGLSGTASSPRGLILDEVTSALLLPWRVRRTKVSLVYNYNSFAMGISAALVAKRNHVPVVYDLADDLAETVIQFVPHVLRRVARNVARLVIAANVRLADGVTLTTETLADRYAARASRRVLVPNGVDADRFLETRSGAPISSRPMSLVYVGTLRDWLDFTPVLDAMRSVAAAGIPCELVIVGEGAAEARIRRQASEAGVARSVRFLGPVHYDRVPGILSQADACVLPFDAGAISEAAFPLKLLEYMAARRPVIASPLPAVRRVAGDLVWYASTGEEYAQAIRDIHEQVATEERLEHGARLVRETYSWDAARRKLRELVSDLTSS